MAVGVGVGVAIAAAFVAGSRYGSNHIARLWEKESNSLNALASRKGEVSYVDRFGNRWRLDR